MNPIDLLLQLSLKAKVDDELVRGAIGRVIYQMSEDGRGPVQDLFINWLQVAIPKHTWL